MFKASIKTVAATIVAVGCLSVSAEAGNKAHHKGHGGYSSFHGSSFGGAAWPAGKGCGGPIVYRRVAVAPVAVKAHRSVAVAPVVLLPRAPACVC